jgi:hypothetical protein
MVILLREYPEELLLDAAAVTQKALDVLRMVFRRFLRRPERN